MIVVASTWRWRQTLQELQDTFTEAGVTAPVVDKCPWLFDDTFDLEDPGRKPKYIPVEKRANNWLWVQRHLPAPEDRPEAWPTVPKPLESWVLLEDDINAMWDDPRCILTNRKTGLSEYDVGMIIRFLGTPGETP